MYTIFKNNKPLGSSFTILIKRNNFIKSSIFKYFTEKDNKTDQVRTEKLTKSVNNEEIMNSLRKSTELVENISLNELKKMIDEIDINIENNVYYTKNLPDPNYFGDALIYMAPPTLLSDARRGNIEITGIITMTGITILNYFGLLFPSNYLFPLFALWSLVAYLKFYRSFFYPHSIVYQIRLSNEHELKIVYTNGQEEKVDIKNINVSMMQLEAMGRFIPQNRPPPPKKVERLDSNVNKPQYLERPAAQLSIPIRINGITNSLIYLRTYGIGPRGGSSGFAELELLLGILNKKTKRLAIDDAKVSI